VLSPFVDWFRLPSILERLQLAKVEKREVLEKVAAK
jgi:hypothetical protein